MSMTSDDSRGAEHSGSTRQISTANHPPFSNLALTVNQVNRTLDLGNPVSCWSRQAASFLMQSPAFTEPSVVPEPVQRGYTEALNQVDLPQTMVGTVLQMSLLVEQIINGLSSDQEPQQLESLAARYRRVADANLVSIPWHVAMDGRELNAEILTRLEALLNGSET